MGNRIVTADFLATVLWKVALICAVVVLLACVALLVAAIALGVV